MAGFVEVMSQFARLCDYYSQSGCHGCPVDEEGFNCACEKQGCSKTSAEELEHIIMQWAAEHPVYPTWGEWLKQTPFIEHYRDSAGFECRKYNWDTSIPADLAEKLGIEPKEG